MRRLFSWIALPSLFGRVLRKECVTATAPCSPGDLFVWLVNALIDNAGVQQVAKKIVPPCEPVPPNGKLGWPMAIYFATYRH
ncbi:hypothetical protein [Mesorhizobium sp. CA7]|uniref:hypothetical protein n=1 Tax=Mesorhizobium sp. CA7 TaxID=588501 RepID=UPI001CCB060D|nr:hypothetical protein [Mesorhizobium sp. CA7]MBZ9815049.1 hypothetical protein [Mesorhizobium sp. CA7]